MTAPRFPLARLIAEGVAVVLSILLAFSIDAAWDARGDRAQERALLRSLSDDFRANRERVVEGAASHARNRQAALDLIDVVDGKAVLPEPAQLDSLIELAFVSGPTLNLTNGSLDALLASGRLNIISSDELRPRLAAWPSRVEDTTEDERWLISEVQQRTIPYLYSKLRIRNLIARHTFGGALSPGEAVDYGVLWTDSEFENHLAMRIFNEAIILSEFAELSAELDDLLSLLTEQLER